MELYIDINNLKSFIKSKDSDDFDDCKRMLRRQLHVIYNFDKELLRSEPVLQQFVTMISEGRGRSEESDKFLSSTSMFPERPIKSNSYSKWDWQQLSGGIPGGRTDLSGRRKSSGDPDMIRKE